MKHHLAFRSLLALVFLFFVSASAQALSFRAYLSSAGSDASPCTLVSPCRLLPAALAAVADRGEIWMLDSANYNTGPVSITKSVTILAIPGAMGSVVSLGGNAIDITTDVTVTMRNLVIVPFERLYSASGIVMTAGNLTLEHSVVANLRDHGINVFGAARLVLSHSSVRNNGIGVVIRGGGGATITGTEVTGNGHGVYAEGFNFSLTRADITSSTLSGNGAGLLVSSRTAGGVVKASVRDSLLAMNAAGAVAVSEAGGEATVALTNTTVSNHESDRGVAASGNGARMILSTNTITANATGVSTANGARMILSTNTIAANQTGIATVSGGVTESAGDNTVRGNGTDQVGTPVTPISRL